MNRLLYLNYTEFLSDLILYLLHLLARWVNFERVIERLVAQQTYQTNVDQLQIYAKDDCFIEDEDEFHIMLNFYHDLGVIVRHQSTVVLKAQWLIDLFKHLITIPPFEKSVRNFIFSPRFRTQATAKYCY